MSDCTRVAPLHAPHVVDSIPAGEVRVLARRLLPSAPLRIIRKSREVRKCAHESSVARIVSDHSPAPVAENVDVGREYRELPALLVVNGAEFGSNGRANGEPQTLVE